MPFDFANVLPVMTRAQREAQRGRLGKQHADALVDELAAVIRLAFEAGATSSLFGLEGALRHAIRSDLCLQGWRWRDANLMAIDLMDEAFRRVRAVRPSWAEGQTEWTISEGLLIERTRCQRCHKSLVENQHKFCSDICRTSHHARLTRLREANTDTALHMVIRST